MKKWENTTLIEKISIFYKTKRSKYFAILIVNHWTNMVESLLKTLAWEILHSNTDASQNIILYELW